MSFSSNMPSLREKEQKIHRSFLVFSFMGSVVLHILLLTLSSLWLKRPKPAQQPIEFIIVDPPNLQAAKPKQKIKPKDKIVAIDTHQPIKTIAPPKSSSVPPGSGIIRRTSESASQSTASQSAIAPPRPLAISKKLPQPTKEATTQKPIANKLPKLVETPKLASKRVTTLSPKTVETPNLAQTLSPLATPLPESVQTSSPKHVATLPPKLVEAPKALPTSVASLTPKLLQTQTPKQVSIPTPNLTATPKPTSTSHLAIPLTSPITPSLRQEIPFNGSHPLDTPNRVGERKSVAIGSGNRESTDSTGGTGTRRPRQDSGSGGSSGNDLKVGTGPRNGNGNSSLTTSGSGGVACHRCPAPDYPSGSENLEGRAVVEINIDKDGNVRNVQIVKSTGYNNLDQTVLETVKKKWKFASSENEQRVRAAVNFAMTGSDFYHQASEREHQASELEHQRKRERLIKP